MIIILYVYVYISILIILQGTQQQETSKVNKELTNSLKVSQQQYQYSEEQVNVLNNKIHLLQQQYQKVNMIYIHVNCIR